MAKKLPLGIQDFRKIIEGGYKYIDKTQYIHSIAIQGGPFFLSRPRRFGKSITLSVLEELYSGSEELFRGLWIADKWDWSRKHPVVKLVFTGIGLLEVGLEQALHEVLDRVYLEHQVPAFEGSIANRLSNLIHVLRQINTVVVLVDEYDAPIVQYFATDMEKACEHRDQLKEFFSVLKNHDKDLELVFITGVSKFSKVGIFSGMNNLTDLTMNARYATMLGYTQEELEAGFAEEIEATAEVLNMSRAGLLEEIRQWYNGYRFEEDAKTVYNPVSLNMFFFRQELKNFWFETGTPTLFIQQLRQQGLYDFRLEPQPEHIFDSFDLDSLNIFGLLYQTGYLTLAGRNDFGLYVLDYPNHEVRHSMTGYLLEAFGGLEYGRALPLIYYLETHFQAHEVNKAMELIQGMFKTIPYHLHERFPEKFFHAAIHLMFTYMGVTVQSEVATSDGRIDAVVETRERVYLFEFKLDQSPEVALAQIREKRYFQAFWAKGKPVFGIGIEISSQTKTLARWEMEQLGQ